MLSKVDNAVVSSMQWATFEAFLAQLPHVPDVAIDVHSSKAAFKWLLTRMSSGALLGDVRKSGKLELRYSDEGRPVITLEDIISQPRERSISGFTVALQDDQQFELLLLKRDLHAHEAYVRGLLLSPSSGVHSLNIGLPHITNSQS